MLLAHRIRLDPTLAQRDYFARAAGTARRVAGMVPAGGGKVTPVRHEHGQQDGSGQEENGEHKCAPF
jgi:putative transposase